MSFEREFMDPQRSPDYEEAIADLTELWIFFGDLTPNNRNDRVNLVLEWAREFSEKHRETEWDGEYRGELHRFFLNKHCEWKSSTTDTRPNYIMNANNYLI